ncbi:MAG TPA: sugar ABC transporter permease [Armatimonadota bacterium]|jgi:multiple sugar transport system permease protein
MLLAVGVRRRTSWRDLEGYLFISPWLLGFLLFTLGPMLVSFGLSLTKWDLLRPTPLYVGLSNYQELLRDPDFFLSLRNTLYYTLVSVPVGMAGSLAVALLLNQKVRGIQVFRTIYYLPAVTSSVAMYLLWKWLLSPDLGLVNQMLQAHVPLLTLSGVHWVPLIASPPEWLADPNWAIPALILMNLWYLGSGMIIYLAGLQGVPEHLYEAAELDGAGAWHKLRHITLPMLSPTIFFNLTMSIIGSFQVFTAAFVMTQGGPAKATLFYVLLLYQTAFDYLRMGSASAMAWILFVVIVILTVINFRVASRWVHYD